MNLRTWADSRAPAVATHLDIAACGRMSTACVAAQIGHLAQEAEGGYVAELEAEPTIAAGRAALAGMVGLAGTDVAFAESASAAFHVVLDSWPLDRGARIGTIAGEYGGNAAVLRLLADRNNWSVVPLETDDLGRVQHVPADLDLVTFPQVGSHRGVAQPVEVALASGVPLILDVAQSLGQRPVPAGAAAYVGTSRKWLCGPRGVGFAMVARDWERRLASPPTLAPTVHEGIRRLESLEANVAGRVGLAVAATEWTPELMTVIQARASAARAALAATGWRVVEPVDEPTGITTLEPPPGEDPVGMRARLAHEGVLVSAIPTSRATELTAPVLRVSTAAWVQPDDLNRLVAALSSRG